jgi:predicted HTH transcriptional regulator
MSRLRIFISSVQKELAAERRAIREFVDHDPLLRRFFDVFLFEDAPASSRRADEVYLAEVDAADVYLGLFGNDYGFEDAEGLSPTEREFDRATAQGKTRLIFVKGADDQARHPKMRGLVRKAGNQLIRRRFSTIAELTAALSASLVELLIAKGPVQDRPFEEQPCPDATLDGLDPRAVAAFVRRAREERQFPLAEGAAMVDVLTHLNLLLNGQPTKAAVLLFGRNPHRFLPSAEVRCMHFHGTEIARPVPFYRIFKGNLFDQVDLAHDFVMSKLNRSVGTRAESAQAPVRYEIPSDVVREAIVNAIAHRDYASDAAVQVLVFADRFEVWNPGQLPPPLTPEKLRHPHSSIARNHRVCETLFLARYIEKFGTGTLMMIRECRTHALPEPDFLQRSGEFVTTVARDWLTEKVIAELGLNERQKQAVTFVRTQQRIGNIEYQQLSRTIKKTASRDLDDLVRKGVFDRVGTTGRGTYYCLARKGDIKGTIVPTGTPLQNGDIKGTKGTSTSRTDSATNQPDGPSTQTRQKPDKQDTNRPTSARPAAKKPTSASNVPKGPKPRKATASQEGATKGKEGQGSREARR